MEMQGQNRTSKLQFKGIIKSFTHLKTKTSLVTRKSLYIMSIIVESKPRFVDGSRCDLFKGASILNTYTFVLRGSDLHLIKEGGYIEFVFCEDEKTAIIWDMDVNEFNTDLKTFAVRYDEGRGYFIKLSDKPLEFFVQADPENEQDQDFLLDEIENIKSQGYVRVTEKQM